MRYSNNTTDAVEAEAGKPLTLYCKHLSTRNESVICTLNYEDDIREMLLLIRVFAMKLNAGLLWN